MQFSCQEARCTEFFSPNLFVVFKKGSSGHPRLLSSSLFTNNTLVSFISSTLYTYLYRSLFCMPLSPQPYPSFTLVMSSAPFAPFAANDNMRLPAHRTSHLARFHPYSRAHPSLHHERLMVRLYLRLRFTSRSTTN